MKPCPACGKSDQVAKVSILYMEGLQRKRATKKTQPVSEAVENKENSALPLVFVQLNAASLEALGSRLKPPASGKEWPIRPVHPDLIVLVFSLIAPFFLVQIYTSQPGMIIPMLIILGGFYGFFLWKRKSLLAKFEQEKDNRRRAEEQVKRGIERWMRLYYCARDDGIFSPGADRVVPAEQMLAHVMQE